MSRVSINLMPWLLLFPRKQVLKISYIHSIPVHCIATQKSRKYPSVHSFLWFQEFHRGLCYYVERINFYSTRCDYFYLSLPQKDGSYRKAVGQFLFLLTTDKPFVPFSY